MTCPAWQRLLDDNPRGTPAGLIERHARSCPDCAEHRAEILHLGRALPHLAAPEPPAGLADAITAALLAARRPRPHRWAHVGALAAAAALLLAVGLGLRLPTQPRPERQAVAKGPSLRETAAKAGDAGARLFNGTVERAKHYLPTVGPVPMESSPDPALRPLRETADGVTAGLAPVTDSARRAVNVFFRDMPLGLKPG